MSRCSHGLHDLHYGAWCSLPQGPSSGSGPLEHDLLLFQWNFCSMHRIFSLIFKSLTIRSTNLIYNTHFCTTLLWEGDIQDRIFKNLMFLLGTFLFCEFNDYVAWNNLIEFTLYTMESRVSDFYYIQGNFA